MAAYDLNERQRTILRELVAASRKAGTDEFRETGGRGSGLTDIVFEGEGGADVIVKATAADIFAMEKLSALELSGVTFGGMSGQIPRASFDAVDQNFPNLAASAPANVFHVTTTNHAPNYQQAIGPNARQTMTIGDTTTSADLVSELRRMTADLIAGLTAGLADADAVRVKVDAEAVIAEATRPEPDAREISDRAGTFVSRALKVAQNGGKLATSVDETARIIGPWFSVLWHLIKVKASGQ